MASKQKPVVSRASIGPRAGEASSGSAWTFQLAETCACVHWPTKPLRNVTHLTRACTYRSRYEVDVPIVVDLLLNNFASLAEVRKKSGIRYGADRV